MENGKWKIWGKREREERGVDACSMAWVTNCRLTFLVVLGWDDDGLVFLSFSIRRSAGGEGQRKEVF